MSTRPVLALDPGVERKPRRNALTSGVAASFPFASYELSDKNGVFLGINMYNKTPVFLDPYDDYKYTNGNWWIGGVDTGIKAEGSDGADGSDGSDGKDGQDGKDGEDGKDGLTPYIGSNGNWWIGTTDTGIKAAGVNGADGKDGKDGINGKAGANGENGANGKDGADGDGIADIKLGENDELIVTLTDGTEKNLGKVKGEDGVGISGVSINENGELIVRQGGYLLRVRMSGIPGRYLNAPSRGRMTRRIRENLACTAEYTLLYRGKTLLREVTDCAAYEYETKEEKNEDRINHGRKDQRKIFERCNR